MTTLNFDSAYTQLQPSEREFVDGFVRYIDAENSKAVLERLTTTLQRAALNARLDEMDSRTRAMFGKPLVTAAIRERVEQIASERDLTPARIVQEHAALAMANMADYMVVGEDGIPLPDLSNLTTAQWAAIQEIQVDEEFGKYGSKRKIKFKLYNKQTSLDSLAEWSGLKKDGNELFAKYMLDAKSATVSTTETLTQVADRYSQLING